MDLTSDTVDAAHLAKGYTAHDAGGNIIVGTLGQQQYSDLLSGVTPSLLNGATQSGKTYVIPSGIAYGTELIEYQLDIPTLKSDEVYCVFVYGNTQSDFRPMFAALYSDSGTHYGSRTMMFGEIPSAQVSSYDDFTAGEKPTRLVITNASDKGEQLSISKIMIMILNI